MRDKEGSSTLTYRLKLQYKNLDWLVKTKELYNDVLLYYYLLLLKRTELLEYGNQRVLRELEILTITARDKTKPEYPLPQEKIPVYFRRAAINGAIGLVRTYHSKYIAWSNDSSLEKSETTGKPEKPEAAEKFNAQPLFYKGMYKEFDSESILLKLWSGTSWIWVKHKVKGRKIPKDAEILSPTLAVNKDKVMLHVPVKSKVADIRTVKERVTDKERICSVSLSSSDTLAVCTILESDGSILDSCFIRGGNELKHRRKRLLGMIARNQRLSGGAEKGSKNNVMLFRKQKAITDYYSHLVSRRIIDFCEMNNVKIIVFQSIDGIVPVKGNQYIDVCENDFIIRRVIQYAEYKAFAKGMVVTTVRPNYTSCKCHKCRAYVKKYNKSAYTGEKSLHENSFGKYYVCENGHQGNAYLNTSRNIGLMFMKKAEFIKAG